MLINAKDYSKIFYKDNFYFLLNLDNKEIQYLINWSKNKIQFLKIVPIQKILKIKQYNRDQVYNYLYDHFDNIKNDNRIIKKYLIFKNIDQVIKYLQQEEQVDSDDLQKIFQIEIQKRIISNKNFDLQISNNLRVDNIDYYIRKIKDIVNKANRHLCKIEKIKIVLKNNIIQQDSLDIGGNYINDKNGYNAVINISVRNTQFNLWHQLGHYYQDNYINNIEHEQIYLFVLQNNQLFNCKNDYFLYQNECIPQLIAHYFLDQLNDQAKKFVQEKILK